MRCPACGHPEEPGARFCTSCGAPLGVGGWARALGTQDGTWRLGRGEQAELRIDSPVISALHLQLEREDGRWFATDLGSTNGSFVDGRRLTPHAREPIPAIATLHLGSFTLTAAAISAAHRRLRIDADEGRELVVGRDPACDLVLDAPTLSPRHAALRRVEGLWRIRDLGSRAGTWVNGEPIRGEHTLRPGDRVELGTLRLVPESLASGQLRAIDYARELRLDIDGVTVTAPDGVRLLDQVRLSVQPGELVLLMGPSGAGKSTLMQVMCGALPPDGGAVRVSGLDLYQNRAYLGGLLGYVPQEILLPRALSARRVLRYAAALRLPPDAVPAQVQRVLESLELEGCADLPVGGDGLQRGLSGGQRRRLNLGVELLADPGALFLDEPCSGLDARSGMSMLRLAREIADRGKPVIVTIHQPRAEALELADHVALLSRGRLCWFGPPEELPAFVAAQGGAAGTAHALATPTDLAVDALDPGPGQAEETARRWAQAYAESETQARWVQARLEDPEASRGGSPPRARSDGLQLAVLTRRRFAVLAAERGDLALLVLQAPIIGALLLALFGDQRFLWVVLPGVPLKPVDQVSPALFLMAAAMLWLGCNNAARELVQERALFRRERRWGLGLGAYVSSKVTVQYLIAGLQAAVLTGAAAWMGMPQLPRLWIALTLTGWAGAGIGLALSAFSPTRYFAALRVPELVRPQIMPGGL
ncbi:MAG: FHA domain-containing protein, partial [Alphaproteobacteria bacterium]|nr:FHA domain-containing protein [Alphaproteobacteria bacterium]